MRSHFIKNIPLLSILVFFNTILFAQQEIKHKFDLEAKIIGIGGNYIYSPLGNIGLGLDIGNSYGSTISLTNKSNYIKFEKVSLKLFKRSELLNNLVSLDYGYKVSQTFHTYNLKENITDMPNSWIHGVYLSPMIGFKNVKVGSELTLFYFNSTPNLYVNFLKLRWSLK